MKKIKLLTTVLLIALLVVSCQSTESNLQNKLEELTCDFPGEVGIALIFGKDTVCVNGDTHFPMFSVVKFHQALAVCEKLRANKVYLSTQTNPNDIKVTAADLKPDTWSPMRDEHPNGGIFSIQQLMEYSLIQSDNNACDILFNNIANPAQVEEYIHNCGITECGIARTEDEQHADISSCYDNWTTPLAAAQLLGKFYEERELDDYSRFIWNTMANCETGANRIPKYIGSRTTTIVHKTGTGGISSDGKILGINDIACIILPNKRHCELAIFVKDATCDAETCEELIANIAKVCVEKLYKYENNSAINNRPDTLNRRDNRPTTLPRRRR